MLRSIALVMAAGAAVALPASAQAKDYAGTALNIVPSGEQGSVPVPAGADREAKMYDALTPLFDQVRTADLKKHFKSEGFGVGNAGPGKTEKVSRKGVKIVRDKYNVAHITAKTNDGLTWAAGWVMAQDRGLLLEQARWASRVAAVGVPNLTALSLITSLKKFTPSPQTETEIAKQTGVLRKAGKRGRRALHDIDVYISGINAYLRKTKSSSAKWTRNDVYALNALKGQFLGQGGGDEVRRSMFFAGLQARKGAPLGQQIFDDLRQRDVAGQPTSIDGKFPYGTVPADKSGNVLVDPASYQPVTFPATATAASTAAARSAAEQTTQAHASNVLLVSGKRSANKRPLMVGGPQIGYYYPGLTIEMDLHGPGVHVRGVTSAPYPGYMLIGRGEDFAWTLTSASADIIDQYVETLCGDDTHYSYKGTCRAMDQVNAGVLDGVGQITFNTTVHGPVVGYATVGGRRVAISAKRSTYGRDVLDQLAAQQLTDGTVKSPKTFIKAMQSSPQTFNAFYIDNKHIAETTTGRLPLRPRNVDPGLPTDGTGNAEWTGFLKAKDHPSGIDPKDGTIINWNNRVAKGFEASDAEWNYGTVQRVTLLKKGVAARKKHTLATLTSVMNAAATQDVRAITFLPTLSKFLRGTGAPSPRLASLLDTLDNWTRAGGSRLDRDGDGKIDDPGAAILDTAWTRLADAVMAPVLGDQIEEYASLVPRFDAPPKGQFGGWYSIMNRDLAALSGQKVTQPLATKFCGNGSPDACRQALWAALASANDTLTAAQGADVATWRADANAERISFVPGLLPYTMRYTNRPSGIQQLIWFRGHR